MTGAPLSESDLKPAEELRKRYTKWVMERSMTTDIEVWVVSRTEVLYIFVFIYRLPHPLCQDHIANSPDKVGVETKHSPSAAGSSPVLISTSSSPQSRSAPKENQKQEDDLYDF